MKKKNDAEKNNVNFKSLKVRQQLQIYLAPKPMLFLLYQAKSQK